MKKINLKKSFIKISVLMISTLAIFASCKKNEQKIEESEIQIETEEMPHWENSAEKICVVFGYGYNDENFVKTEVEHLETKFGLSDGTENSGMILPFVYPDDFKVGNTGRISRLVQLIEDVKIKGLITIGAPEYANNTLALLREKMEDGETFPIYTFFPQDDILAIEATSDFVLDKAVEQSADNIESMKNENDQELVIGIEKILDSAIKNICKTDSVKIAEENATNDVASQNAKLFETVSQIVGTEYKIKHYVDPETGLASINHFIIEEND